MKITLKNIEWKYVNLDHRQDRREHIEKEMQKAGITGTRFPAANTHAQLPEFDFRQYNTGAKACFISHYTLMHQHSGDKIIGILEDDTVFCDDFRKRMAYIENNFHEDWDIFFLSAYYYNRHYWRKCGLVDYELTDTRYINRVYGAFCTHSFLVNPKSKYKIFELFKKHCHESYAIDHLLILIQPYLKCFSFTPGMTYQYTNHSDIGGSNKEQLQFFLNECGPHLFVNKLGEFDFDKYFGFKERPKPIKIIEMPEPVITTGKKALFVIPFRNRMAHLQEFIRRLKSVQMPCRYEIAVIEQGGKKPFNRGALLNTGVRLNPGFDYYIFHDVDMMPVGVDYSYPETPTHLASQCSQFGYKMPYAFYLGGVALFSKEDFEKVNGFSNDYWGWGKEDDDLAERCNREGFVIVRRACRFESLAHERIVDEKLLAANCEQIYNMAMRKIDYKTAGLNNVKYRVSKRVKYDECSLTTVTL